jgi:hypothetical protein
LGIPASLPPFIFGVLLISFRITAKLMLAL